MNAYELADAVEDWETGANYTVSIKAAQMLRQQADRIAELEKVSKPVAWMDYLEHSDVYDLNVSGRGIPLYTTPQIKELSDEEINKLWAESHKDGIAMQQGFTTQQHYFAHLILKKASEK